MKKAARVINVQFHGQKFSTFRSQLTDATSNIRQAGQQELPTNEHWHTQLDQNTRYRVDDHLSHETTSKHIEHRPIHKPDPQNLEEVDVSILPSSSSPYHLKNDTREILKTTRLNELPTIAESGTPWSTGKKMMVGIITTTIIVSAVVAAAVPAILLTQQNKSPTTMTTTISTTSIPSINVTAYWTFDNTIVDYYGVFNGQLMKNATYSPVSSNSPYVGHGQALRLSATSNDTFTVSSVTFPLNYTSFTIEAWIYATSVANDQGIFSQCQCTSCSNQCFIFTIRSSRLYADFLANDVSGSTNLLSGTWYHVAFVYNYQTQQQMLYLNGVQNGIKSNAQPYQGNNGSTIIGLAPVYSVSNYFSGYIDNVIVTTRAKSSTEILRDASVVAYYSFDLPNPMADNGPNGLNGASNTAITVTGRVNQGLYFSGSTFQAYGFYGLPYGVSVSKYSIALWIKPPSSYTMMIINSYNSFSSYYNCQNLLGIYSPLGTGPGQLFVHGPSWSSSNTYITGPYVTTNAWSHIVFTYSSSNGYKLYVNGSYFGTSGSVGESLCGTFAYLSIGGTFSCYSSMSYSSYQGYIDEVYIYNREITQSDVTSLANP